MKKLSVVLVVLLNACVGVQPNPLYPSGQIFYGGDILTMAGEKEEYVESLIVERGKIVFVGPLDKARTLVADSASGIDLNGHTLMPGFIDAHSHFTQTAAKRSAVSLDPPPAGDVRSISDIVSKLSAELKAQPQGAQEWLVGWGFDNGMLSDKRFPTRRDLDAISTETPILVMHFSGHMLVMNSAGLRRAAYTVDSVPPQGGILRRDQFGELNGVIEETAMMPAFAALTKDVLGPQAGMRLGLPIRDDLMLGLLRETQSEYLSRGFTTISDFASTPDDLALLQQLRDEGGLLADVVAHIHTSTAGLDQVRNWYSPDYDRHLRVGGGKINLDGGTPGRTAFLREPYHTQSPGQDEDYRGYSSIPDQAQLDALVASYYQARVPIFIHALGDAALEQCILAVSSAENTTTYDDIRTQLIHLQVVGEDQLEALKALDVTLTFQNTHNYYFADFHNESTLGPDRTRRLTPMKSAIDRGFSTTFHHDSPVHPVDQLMLVWIAASRESRSGKVFGPEERLSVYQALRAATIEGAYQFREETSKGSLEVGKLADMVVLDRNPLNTPIPEIRDIQILQTLKEGVTVYKRAISPERLPAESP